MLKAFEIAGHGLFLMAIVFYKAQRPLQGARFILALPLYAVYNRRHIQIYYESTSGSVRNKIISPIFPA